MVVPQEVEYASAPGRISRSLPVPYSPPSDVQQIANPRKRETAKTGVEKLEHRLAPRDISLVVSLYKILSPIRADSGPSTHVIQSHIDCHKHCIKYTHLTAHVVRSTEL